MPRPYGFKLICQVSKVVILSQFGVVTLVGVRSSESPSEQSDRYSPENQYGFKKRQTILNSAVTVLFGFRRITRVQNLPSPKNRSQLGRD
jgi:thymidylate synthase ThyX